MALDNPLYRSAVREMPEEDRPRERLARLGPEALRDAELIAVLLRTGTKEMGAVRLAEELIHQFGSLRAISQASLEEIQLVKGMGKVKAIEIKAALELGIRLSQHTEPIRKRIGCAKDVADYLMVRYKDLEVEQFKCLFLNTKNEILKKPVDISQGGLDGTLAVPRDVFKQAVREGVSAVIVCHNHPSGDPEPSRDDIELTKRLCEAADILGIRLLDHIIFGDGRHVSLKERNMM